MENPCSAIPDTLNELVNLLESEDLSALSHLQGRHFSIIINEFLTFRDMEPP